MIWLELDGDQCDIGLEFHATCAKPSVLNLDQIVVDPAWALRIPAKLAARRLVLPFAQHGGFVHVACADPGDASAIQSVQRFLRQPLRAERADPESLQRAIGRMFGGDSRQGGPLVIQRGDQTATALDLDAEDAVSACDTILRAAILRGASDIHFDPMADDIRLRFRIDGLLEDVRRISTTLFAGVAGRLKVMAGMDIAEKRSPQDGRFRHRYTSEGLTIDIRAATLPTKHGERITLRLLGLQVDTLTLNKLGMRPSHLRTMVSALDQPHGLVLLTGPTGCGKTTTLYAAIRHLIHRERLNVVTIEDPVEYDMPGVAQVEVDSADKVSFTKALRSLIRHDPDVVMIGEIRDYETAEVALRAALTGHLVFSTLHTNSAAGAITRLVDLGVEERYLISATLRLVVAQRLVRRLCSHLPPAVHPDRGRCAVPWTSGGRGAMCVRAGRLLVLRGPRLHRPCRRV